MQNVVRVAVRTAGKPGVRPDTEISNTSTYAANPTVALDQQGDAVVAYGLGATPAGVALNAYDVGPSLAAPSIPVSAHSRPARRLLGGHADRRVRIGEHAELELWRWLVGAGGTAVSHVYSKRGTYACWVGVTDGAGVTVTKSGRSSWFPRRCRTARSRR